MLTRIFLDMTSFNSYPCDQLSDTQNSICVYVSEFMYASIHTCMYVWIKGSVVEKESIYACKHPCIFVCM
jgi:hypothetical protein